MLRCVRDGDVRHLVWCEIGSWALRRDSGGCPASSGGDPGDLQPGRARVISILPGIAPTICSSTASSATLLRTDCVLLASFLCTALIDAVASADWATPTPLSHLF
jgi:hypothetical protein